MRRSHFLASFSLLVVLGPALPAQAPAPRPLPPERQKGFASIDPEHCRAWLEYLASDELEGRATGQPGYQKAAEYVAARFGEFGLKPVGDDGTFFQKLPFEATGVDAEQSWFAVVDEEGKELLRLRPGEGLGGSISEKSEQDLDLVLLVATSAQDIVEEKLRDKAVLFIDKSPPARFGTEASMGLRRLRNATLLRIDDAAAATSPRRVSMANPGARPGTARFRMPNRYALTRKAAEKLVAAAGIAATALDANESVFAEATGLKLRVHIEVKREPAFAANVVGLLAGSDPELAHEIVGIGSHLDHIGRNGNQINNGADDDGSGSVGVLAVAKAFATNPHRPRRSILFMCFCGEEMGLVGSSFYAEHPIFPNENMVAEIQMDMIGRNEEKVNRQTGAVTERAEDNLNTLHLVGTQKLSQELHEICLAMNEAHVGFDFEYDEESVFYRSDHVSFARKDIPIAFLFTGFHPQYHRPDDTVDKIDFPKLARVAQLAYAIVFEIAERPQRPKLDRKFSEIQRGR